MDKAIYKIRGNVFFKLGIYILVAVLANLKPYIKGLGGEGGDPVVLNDDYVGAAPHGGGVKRYLWVTKILLFGKGKTFFLGSK